MRHNPKRTDDHDAPIEDLASARPSGSAIEAEHVKGGGVSLDESSAATSPRDPASGLPTGKRTYP